MSDRPVTLENLSPEQLAALVSKLQRRPGGESEAPRRGPSARPRDRELWPLSPAQERLWFLDRLEPGLATYNIAVAFEIQGVLDRRALSAAWIEIQRRHEILRTTFEVRDGKPRQRPEGCFPSAPAWGQGAAPDLTAGLQRATEESRRPFDLATGPLLRCCVIPVVDGSHVLVLVLHHILGDGWSAGILLRELGALYGAALEGSSQDGVASGAGDPAVFEGVLPPLPLHYVDFAAWQMGQLESGAWGDQLEGWRNALDGAPETLELAVDRTPGSGSSGRGMQVRRRLGGGVHSAVEALARELRCSTFSLLVAAWGALLGRLTGSADLLLATPVAGRRYQTLEPLVGCFVNTLLLRLRQPVAGTFAELVRQAHGEVAQATARQELPFAHLVRELNPQRSLGHAPLAQVMVVYDEATPTLELPGARCALRPLDTGMAKYHWLLAFRGRGDDFEVALELDLDRFDEETGRRHLEHLGDWLESTLAAPHQPLGALPWLSPGERHQLLAEWGAGDLPSPPGATLHQAVMAQALGRASQPASWCGGEALSYGELESRSRRLALRLLELGIGAEEVVAVRMERSLDLLPTLLGVLRAGAAYVPIDPAYPPARQALMMEDSAARWCLTDAGSTGPGAGAPADLAVADLLYGPEPVAAQLPRVRPQQLAYVIYTSGSTGRPKGVELTHRAAAELVRWAGQSYSPRELAGVLAATSVCFDLSIFELFAPLAHGGGVILVDDALAFVDLPPREAERVTLINTVPSAITELLRGGALPTSLLTVNLAGEALPRELVRRLYESGVGRVWNLYGPSEDTTYSTAALVSRGGEAAPSIGRPLPGSFAVVTDGGGAPQPVGVPGELRLGGVQLARGYRQRPALTAERFVPDPWSAGPGGRLYRTGDRVRWRRDGRLSFLGRLDQQVKVRGFRIEIGEVESALRALPLLADAAVAVVGQGAARRLGALVTLAAGAGEGAGTGEGAGVLSAVVAEDLGRRLPAHMVPAVIFEAQRLPRLPNGKVDRRAVLRQLEGGEAGASRQPPEGDEERLVAGLFQRLLEISEIGRDDDFFALGGHSLLAFRAVNDLRQITGVELPVRALFEQPTVRALALILTQLGAAEAGEALRRSPQDGPAPLSFEQERLWFLERLGEPSAVYNLPLELRLEGPLQVAALHRALRLLVVRQQVFLTRFEERGGVPLQAMDGDPRGAAQLPLVDLGALAPGRRRELADELARRVAMGPFRLAGGPLHRLLLVRTEPGAHRLLACVHHILADGASVAVLLRELAWIYGACCAGASRKVEVQGLPPLPVSYGDYARWQCRRLDPRALERRIEGWRQRLEGASALELPTDRPRPALRSTAGEHLAFRLPAGRSEAVESYARRSGMTPFMVYAAATGWFLGRLAGQRRVQIGSPVANRQRSEVEHLVGFFANTVVIPLDLGPATAESGSGSPGRRALSFDDLARRGRASSRRAFADQDLPLAVLVEALRPERDLSRTPLFQAMVALRQEVPSPSFAGLSSELRELVTATAKFDWTIFLTPRRGGDGDGLVEFATDLFDTVTIERWVEWWGRALDRALEFPQRPLQDLSWLSDSEQRQLQSIAESAAVRLDADQPGPGLHGFFFHHSRRQPQAAALVTAQQRYSYGELASWALAIGELLAQRGVGPGDLVAVALERRPQLLAALLAVLSRGAAYVPLDPAHPARRNAMIVEGCAPVLALVEAGGGVLELDSVPTMEIEGFTSAAGIDAAPAEAPRLEVVDPRQLAYVIYTSGSTGRPKGVALTHGGALELAAWSQATFHGEEAAAVLASTSVCFDLSVFEIFVTLARGATVVLVEDAVSLAQSPPPAAVTLINTVPSAMAELVRLGAVPDSVHTVCLAGEALRGDLVRAIYRDTSVQRVLNLYGPSEDTTYSTLAVMPREGDLGGFGGEPSIGLPIDGTRAEVLDQDGHRVPPGAVGELSLGGRGLARGYYRRPALTAASFVPDPFSSRPGARLYRTGDRVRWIGGGGLHFLGRRDQQVKLRGFRVELGEIEAVLQGLDAVAESAVVVVGEGSAARLAAYYVLAEGGEEQPQETQPQEVQPRELQRALAAHLPEHMVPRVWTRLGELPRTPTGKIQRRALPPPGAASASSSPGLSGRPAEAPRRGPRGQTEERLSTIWSELLQSASSVGSGDDFFALGGHSLLVMQLAARLRDSFGIEVPLQELFQATTLEEQARLLEAETPEHAPEPAAELPAVEVDGGQPLPLSPAQERLWILQQLDPGTSAFVIPLVLELRGPLRIGALETALAAVMQRHEILRTAFSQGDEGPLQQALPARPAPLRRVDLTGLSLHQRLTTATWLQRREASLGFDLGRPPLLRALCIALDGARHELQLTVHHIVADGWSLRVLLREVASLYRRPLDPAAGGRAEDSEPLDPAALAATLEPLPLQFAGAAALQRRWLQSAEAEVDREYWRARLGSGITPLDLPFDRPRPAFQSFTPARLEQRLDAALTDSVDALGGLVGATRFMVVLAAFQELLGRLAGRDDVVVGAPLAGRHDRRLEPLVGLFLNTLALRLDRAGEPTFRQLVERVRQRATEAYSHGRLPFEVVLETVQPERDPSRTSLLQVFLNQLTFPVETLSLPGVEVRERPAPDLASKFDLTLYLRELEGVIQLDWVYNADLFDAPRVLEMSRQLRCLLEAAAEEPDAVARRASLLTPEARQILPDLAAPLDLQARDRAGGELSLRVRRWARERPEAPAVLEDGGALSYRQLDQHADAVAYRLGSQWRAPRRAHRPERGGSVVSHEVVAVLTERQRGLPAVLLGILRSDSAWLILDADYPAPVLAQRLRRAGATALVTLAGEGPRRRGEELRELGALTAAEVFAVDEDGAPVAASGAAARIPASSPEAAPEPSGALAYIAFTSGSSGEPRAVMGTLEPVEHFLHWHVEGHGFSAEDRFALLSGLGHDPLLRDVFTPLWCGATLAVPAGDALSEPGWLARWMERHGVTVLHLTPSLGDLLLEGSEVQLPALRYAFFGGEALSPGSVAQLRRRAPWVRCFNVYGATETPQVMAAYEVPDTLPPTEHCLPLGRGIEGVQLLVLGAAGLAAPGELGEIVIRSPYLSLGYRAAAAATTARFRPDPFASAAAPGGRVYHSGDLGRYELDGAVSFAGRWDRQLSIRGFRVEPAAIEGVLERRPEVRGAAVLAVTGAQGDPALAAFVTADVEDYGSAAEALRRELMARLPAYAVPESVEVLERLPRTPNGKIDAAALRQRVVQQRAAKGSRRTPRSAAEAAIAEIWSEVLGVADPALDVSFFSLGGHSLLATRLVARLQRELGLNISLRALFEEPTVEGLAASAAATVEAATLPAAQPDPRGRHEPFPLTEIQQAYWVGRSGGLELGGVASHRYLEIESDHLDLPRLTAAWRRLVERHDMLRAVVGSNGEQRVLATVEPYDIALTDLSAASAEKAQQHLAQLREAKSHQVLSLDRWPLFELEAVRLLGGGLRLLLSFDYLIADAWSFRLLLQELLQLYESGSAVRFEPLELTFRDYVLAVAAVRRSALYESSRSYWLERIPELPPGPDLPFHKDPATLREQRFRRRSATVPTPLWQRLQQRGRAFGVTASGLLLAAFGEVLGTWSRSPSFSLVLTLFNRLPVHPEVHQLVGDFTTTTLLALHRHPGESFEQRVRRCQRQLWSDLDHRYFSGVEVVREMGKARGHQMRAATPIVFTSTLDLAAVDESGPTPELPGEVVYSVSQTPQVLLDHQVSEVDGALHLNWDAVEEAFPAGMVDSMFDFYLQLLEDLGREDRSWSDSLIGALPRRQLEARIQANATQGEIDAGLLQDGFLRWARREPERIAVVAGDRELSYGELRWRAAAVAESLLKATADHPPVAPGELVAVVMEKGWEQVVATFGILAAGGAYLPADPQWPSSRLNGILEAGGVRRVLTQPAWRESLPWPPALEVAGLAAEGVHTALGIAEVEREDGERIEPAWRPRAQNTDLAYVIFTSGSTGRPKGVAMEHGAALNTCLDINRRFQVGPQDAVLSLSALTFDLSVYDLFGVLGAGGRVVLPPPRDDREPARWLHWIETGGVTLWNTVPALLEMLVRYIAPRLTLGSGEEAVLETVEADPRLTGLRLALLSGDWIPLDLPDRFRALAPSARMVSLGGATEAAIWSILHPIEEVPEGWTSIPYGRPMANQRFHVLDGDLEPCPTWVPGDLYIAGTGLARGYWGDPKRTAAAFFHHPRSGERLYRTGDLGRYHPDGTIEFLGREDSQVKIRGYRIELGEIRAVLRAQPGVATAVAAAVGPDRHHRQLVGYYVPAEGFEERDDELRRTLTEALEAALPDYMVPEHLMPIDKVPLSPNGKVDRSRLPVPGGLTRVEEREYVAPETPVEVELAQLLHSVLETERVGLHDGFFDLGGNSVSAILLISRVRESFDVDLPLRRLFQQPTVAGLATAILEAQAEALEAEEMDEYLAELEGMSEEEVRRLLEEEAG